MNETTAQSRTPEPAPVKKFIALAAIALLVIVGAILAYQAWIGRQSVDLPTRVAGSKEAEAAAESSSPNQAKPPAVSRRLTESELEEEYGLRVRLLAVTAGGGMIDLRLKVVDAEKALQLLGPGQSMPQLVVEGSGAILQAPPVDQELKLEDSTIVFGLYPNSQHAVDPGSTVLVQFGSLLLEPIIAQ